MEALKAQIEDERSPAPAQAGSGAAFCPALLTPEPSSREIQEESILSPFPLNVNPPNQWAWAFPGSLSKRRKMRLLLIWAGLQSLHQETGALEPDSGTLGLFWWALRDHMSSGRGITPKGLEPMEPQACRGQISPLRSIRVRTQQPLASFSCSPQGFSPAVPRESAVLDPHWGNSPQPQTPLICSQGAWGGLPREQGRGAAALSWESLASQRG